MLMNKNKLDFQPKQEALQYQAFLPIVTCHMMLAMNPYAYYDVMQGANA